MLDWQKITAQIQHAETLSLDDLMAELADLRTNSPDIGNEVTRYFARNRRVKSFMETSAATSPHINTMLPNGSLLGVWAIIDHIGSGGMGGVYKARRSDGLYDQLVALKVIQRTDADSLSRFEEERKRLATLEYPGISRIIDGGATKDGYPFMVMEFVEGRSIDDYINEKNLSRSQILNLFKALCAGVTHAHSKLILHRDIKATNVLVDASATVKLIDFGIASIIGETSDGYGGPMTIAYAAPELLMGKPAAVGSDIFALGVLLHELLTGAAQLRNPDGGVTANRASINDEDLFAIISKATAFEQDKRYQSVTSLADDIDAYLDKRPVIARQGSGVYRFKKLVQRNALASVLAAGFVVALSGGMFTSLVMANKATAEATRANAELERGEWLLREGNTRSIIARSTKDAFQFASTQQVDQETIDQHLIEYLTEISDEERENMPEVVAAKVYAVGSHFLSKNDYVTARKILEPWVLEETGGGQMLSIGRGALAYTYVDAGETQLAGEMFKKSAAYYEGTPGVERMDYTNMVIQAAITLDDAEETQTARKAIFERFKIEENAFLKMYLTAKLYQIEYKEGNWDEAFLAQRKAVDMLEDGAADAIAGTDTVHLNLAALYIYLKQNSELALQQIETAQKITDSKKGESKELGRIHQYRAVIDWLEGNNQSALEYMSSCLVLFEKYSGKQNNYTTALAQRGIIEADMGNYEAASKTLRALKIDYEDIAGSWPELLKLYILIRQEGIESGQNFYDSPDFGEQKITGDLAQLYYLQKLKKDGLKI